MPRQMLSVAKRNDEGVRQASEHVDGAVDESDRKARRHHGGDDDGRGIRDFEQQPANHGRKGKVRADRKIDAAREDDEMLAERNDRDHRRLREDVADIRRLQKHRRRDADDHDQDHKDQDRTRAQEAEGERNQGGARSALAPLGLQRHRRPILHPVSPCRVYY